MRIDDLHEADPFGARCGAVVGGRCTVLGCDLLIREAVELAHGRRHVTIVHGDPGDVAASRELSEFYDELRRLGRLRVGSCPWQRRVRHCDRWRSVRRGQHALFEAAAGFTNPGEWTIVATAIPLLS